MDFKFWNEEGTQQDPKEWLRLGKAIRELTGGEDIDIVFEHPGRETFGASVFVTRKGGTITTCASTSGYMHEYDNRYLWMNLKRIISSHFANYRESWEANRLIAQGKIHPTLSRTYRLEDVGQAALDVHHNPTRARSASSCLAPEEGLGVLNHEMRAQHRRDQPVPRRLSELRHLRSTPVRGPPASRGVSFPASARLVLPQSARRESGYRSMSRDQGLSIFDEPESEDGAEETQVLPVTPTDATPDAPIRSRTHRAPEAEPAAVAPPEPEPEPTRSGSRGPARGCTARPPGPTVSAPATPRRAGAHLPRPAVGSPLPVVRRGGYDRAAVDQRLHQLQSEKSGLSSSLTSSEERVIELEADLERLRAELKENSNPTYAGLGGRAASMLKLAEDEAHDVRTASHREAAEIRTQAERDAKAIRADAAREADDMRMVQLKELDEMRARLTADADQERTLAKGEAADMVAAAKREADQVRLAAQQETNELRTTAQREAEQSRAAADREVQEARRTLAVEKERLAREATDHHSNATAETQRLVTEAEERATAAELRAREATTQANAHRQQAQSEAEGLLSRARREAEQITASARTQADSSNATRTAEAERELSNLQAEVERLAKRRDAITAQLGALRDVVSGFAEDES